jgi:hypothetical protein
MTSSDGRRLADSPRRLRPGPDMRLTFLLPHLEPGPLEVEGRRSDHHDPVWAADHFSNGRSRSAAAAGSGTSQTMSNAQYGLCTRRRRIRDRPTECPERRLQHSARGPEGYAAGALIRS